MDKVIDRSPVIGKIFVLKGLNQLSKVEPIVYLISREKITVNPPATIVASRITQDHILKR